MAKQRGRSSINFARRRQRGNKVTYSSARGPSVTYDLSTRQGRSTQRSIQRAGLRGAALGFAAGSPFGVTIAPPIAGAVVGRNRAQNVRIEKLAGAQKLKNTTGKNKNTQRTTTKGHRGTTRPSPRSSNIRTSKGSNMRGQSRKKKTNWAKGADGKFIGSR